MIDIHCHALAGVDDGARSFEVSVEMCRMAAADGITHVVATPHCNYAYDFDFEVNQAKLAELQAAVGDAPKLLLGCDLYLSYDNIRRLIDNRAHFTINQTNYVLVEFGDHFNPDQMDRIFYEMQCARLLPIFTHPERNPVFQRRPELLYHWVTRGCLVQVTAKSYTGGFGRRAQHFSELWLDHNLIHFFASDAHDAKHRPPILSACCDKVVKEKGQEVADLLLRKNPEAVIDGRPLPPGLEPLEPGVIKRKRSWLSFFRR
jgi:protein-tyrosine phosphatase